MKNIFVMALENFNHRMLKTIKGADNYRFHGLLSYQELVAAKRYDMADLMARAEKQVREFEGSVDGLIAYWDFPSTTMAPVLRSKLGLAGPRFESVLRCEHKYWSRLIQRDVVPELVPRFCAFDPFAHNALEQIELNFPFWVKPVQAHSSYLGFKIENDGDFHAAIKTIRARLHRFADPFDYLLQYAELPSEIAMIEGYHCVAEEIISAERQCTLEGYVRHGEPHVYGVVDSLRAGDSPSFTRYQYPSQLPEDLQQRMIEKGCRIMRGIGLDNSAFNIEFYHDPESDRLTLLEVNPRISKSHCPLFYLVEGASHQEVQVRLATGEEIDYPCGAGKFSIAAKFMLRRFENARVVAVPDREQIDRVRDEVPGTMIRLAVDEGDVLSEMEDQDSYSYEYAVVFIGGDSQEELERKYEEVVDRLTFEFEAVPAD